MNVSRPLIPEAILERIEEFSTLKKTGKIVLNVYNGGVVSADINEHIKGTSQKSLDKCHGVT